MAKQLQRVNLIAPNDVRYTTKLSPFIYENSTSKSLHFDEIEAEHYINFSSMAAQMRASYGKMRRLPEGNGCK